MLKETWLLTKVSLMDGYNVNGIMRKGGGKSRLPYALIFIILVPYACFMFYEFYTTLANVGQQKMMVELAAAIVTVMSLFISSYKASGFLFKFKDFDLLTAMPLHTGAVLASRLAVLFFNNLVPVLYIMLMPIMYGIRSGAGAGFYVLVIFLFPMLSVLPMLIGAALSFLISKMSSGMKNRGAASILGAVLIVVFVLVIQFAGTSLTSTILSGGGDAFSVVSAYPIARLFLDAVFNTSVWNVVLYICVNVLLLALFALALAKWFTKINSSLNETAASAKYKMRGLKTSSSVSALYKKELRLYITSSNYLLNTAIGMIIYIVYTVALMVAGLGAVSHRIGVALTPEIIIPVSLAVAGFTIAISAPAAAGISVEGKQLWILKTLPLTFRQVARSKILLNLTVSVPIFAVASIALGLWAKADILTFAAFLAAGLCFAVFVSFYALVINLAFPKLDWKTQIQAVKQSASVLLNMLVGVVIVCAGITVCTLTAIPFVAFAFIASGVFLVGSAVLWKVLTAWGEKKFKTL